MVTSSSISGQLFVVATPIGNLEDFSQRAINTLKAVDIVLAEDTRHSRRLLNHYQIDTPLQACHAHNENTKVDYWLDRIHQGLQLALISDAGTPLIADPGLPLVKRAREQGLPVKVIPGPNAIIAALSVAGLPCHRFSFEGFLMAKASARQRQLKALVAEQRTMVFYETPHRLLTSLADLSQVFGASRQIVLAKELTKTFEYCFCGTVEQVLAELSAQPDVVRGEFVLVVSGAEPQVQDEQAIHQMMTTLLDEQLPLKQAATLAAKLCGCSKNQAYDIGLAIAGHIKDSPFL